MDEGNLYTDESQIKQLAYHFWEEICRPEGSPDEDSITALNAELSKVERFSFV